MNVKKLITLLLAVMMVLAMAACGAKENDKKIDIPGSNTMTDEPKTLEEASALFDSLLAQENAILGENSALWEKVFMAANKDMIMIEDGKNYGQFLLDTIEEIKDQFTEDELTVLREGGEKIRDLEDQLTKLEEKFPELMPETPDGTVSVPAENGKPIEQNSNPFPAFEGKDLDGNPVKSSELFAANTVTVVNFWFTTCKPCVGELGDLEALNKSLAEKGGAVVGINAFTLDGDETAIAEAKAVLAKKGATYRNLTFASGSEAGVLTGNVFAFPTTYVVDQKGNIVGEPIVGAITEKKQAETLNKLIEQAIDHGTTVSFDISSVTARGEVEVARMTLRPFAIKQRDGISYLLGTVYDARGADDTLRTVEIGRMRNVTTRLLDGKKLFAALDEDDASSAA